MFENDKSPNLYAELRKLRESEEQGKKGTPLNENTSRKPTAKKPTAKKPSIVEGLNNGSVRYLKECQECRTLLFSSDARATKCNRCNGIMESLGDFGINSPARKSPAPAPRKPVRKPVTESIAKKPQRRNETVKNRKSAAGRWKLESMSGFRARMEKAHLAALKRIFEENGELETEEIEVVIDAMDMLEAPIEVIEALEDGDITVADEFLRDNYGLEIAIIDDEDDEFDAEVDDLPADDVDDFPMDDADDL